MTRKVREQSPTSIYHIIMRGNNKENIFESDYEKRKICSMLKENMEPCKAEIYAYCVMRNHIHILLRIPFEDLSEFVRIVSSSYAIFYNFIHNRVGHVFQGRFRSECIDSERYFWTCMRYIHLNPVKAGIIGNMLEYNYSSAIEYFTEKRKLLHEKALILYHKKYQDFKGFRAMHEIFEPRMYLDIAEDGEFCKREILEYLMKEMVKKHKIEQVNLLYDTPKFRSELRKRFGEYVHISSEDYKKLLKTLIGVR